MMDVQNNGIKITDPAFSTDVELSNDKRQSFVLKGEHKRKWTAENPNKHIGVCLKIDDALIATEKQNKCDCGLLLDDNRLYLVEFKGDDYKTAVIQLTETKKYFLSNYTDYDLAFHARIVGKSFPKATTELQKAKIDLKNNFGKNYKLFENKGSEKI